MTTNGSSNPDAQLSEGCPGERLRNEFLNLLPLQGTPDRLEQLARLWIRESPIHWIVIEPEGRSGGFLKSSIEERLLDPGRIRQTGSPSPAISPHDWDSATVWEFHSEDGSKCLGVVRLDRPGSERPEISQLRFLTEWLFRKSAEWESQLLAAKLESLAEFSAGAGHEINNPLGTITGRIQLLLMKEKDPGRRQMLEIIGGQALRVRDMIGDVMLFARPPQPKFERIELTTWLPTILPRFSEQATKQGTSLDITLSDGIILWGDSTQAAIAIGALLQNSLNALGEGGTIHLSAELVTQPDSSEPVARITVEDDGPGLTPDEREHLFDPFFSGRQAGRGLGFGLPKAWKIVSMHQGKLQAIELQSQGLRMMIDWPIASSPESPTQAPPVTEEGASSE